MPSPFPGMDPYLEGPEWRSVHTHFASEIARHLSPRLPTNYIVRAEKIHVLANPEQDGNDDDVRLRPMARRSPDVSVVATAGHGRPGLPTTGPALLDAPLHLAVALTEPEPQLTVEVIDLADRSLVTAIEVLSVTNKRGNSRADYLANRNRLLTSASNLLELDFLRTGRRVPMAAPLPHADYFVVLSRADRRPMADVWPLSIREVLPIVPVPLRPGDAEVPLDLQAVLTTMYDVFRFGSDLDYRRPAAVPLTGDDSAWAATLLAGRLQ